MSDTLHRTLVVWWRYGKDHSEEGFRVNPPEVIAAHLDQKMVALNIQLTKAKVSKPM